ncbi:MAG: CocE/NonD family hydrolase [Pseudonocardia sp.]
MTPAPAIHHDAAAPAVRAREAVPADDGTPLATDVVGADPDDPRPVVLLRTPYGRSHHLAEGLGWARAGFTFVAQDVRGRYDSDGCWQPYRHERRDGAATVSWVAAQPWCDGRIAVLGGSYASFTAWVAALCGHPAVRAVLSLVPAVGEHQCHGPGGSFHLASHVRWWLANAHSRTSRDDLFTQLYRTSPQLLATLPVRELRHALWAELPTLLDAVDAGPDATPPYAVTDAELAGLDLPSLHVGGWYDGFLPRTLHQWHTVGAGTTRRPPRMLVVGPWTHDLATGRTPAIGLRRHEPQARMALGGRMADWLTRALDGGCPGGAQVYVTGAERWDTLAQWPPSTTPLTWHCAGGARLLREPPGGPGTDGFRYDPRDPFPSRNAPYDRADLDRRSDAVRYRTGVLDTGIEIAGTPTVRLLARTDAPATDWVARLAEIDTAGRALHLTHGVQVDEGRAAGHVREVSIALGPIATVVPPGHRLRLEITSSDFPDHARNLNTGLDRFGSARTRVARQEVHHGPGGTSLRLPVVAR